MPILPPDIQAMDALAKSQSAEAWGWSQKKLGVGGHFGVLGGWGPEAEDGNKDGN